MFVKLGDFIKARILSRLLHCTESVSLFEESQKGGLESSGWPRRQTRTLPMDQNSLYKRGPTRNEGLPVKEAKDCLQEQRPSQIHT